MVLPTRPKETTMKFTPFEAIRTPKQVSRIELISSYIQDADEMVELWEEKVKEYEEKVANGSAPQSQLDTCIETLKAMKDSSEHNQTLLTAELAK